MCTFVLILIVLELTVPWTNLQVTLINPNVVKLGFIRVTIVEKISLSITLHYLHNRASYLQNTHRLHSDGTWRL